MIFSSVNETDRPKWEWLLSLPIGATFVTRRAIKRECKCICGKVFWEHNGTYPCKFSPIKFFIDKELCVQAKRGGGALCGCGDDENAHRWDADVMGHCKRIGCACDIFKPVRFRIVEGCWHRDWAARQKVEDDMGPWLVEARLEGFLHLRTWLDWYPVHHVDLNKTWRILAKRVI